tara:strand:- start:1849 stop:2325 length:477 start_codon:yes stop_codon:yes gene_type:complete
MKLIMENWRKFASEEEQLDEGFKEVFTSLLMGLSAMGGVARAMDVDINGVQVPVKVMAQKLKADGSPEAASIAKKLTYALKNKGDLDGNKKLDVSEIGLDLPETDLAQKLAQQPAAEEEAPAEEEVDIQGAVKAANQGASDRASDKLGIPRDYTGTGT